jgi:PKD repeat protein
MEKNYKLFLLLLLLLGLSGINNAHAVMSGTYTLNPALPPSATNYRNMASFASDLAAGTRTDTAATFINGPGVSGPVVLLVASGLTLTEQVEFKAVTGASAVNTITIRGRLSTIQFNATVATNKHTIWLNGAKYYTIDSLRVLANSATLAWGMRFSNDASFNKITNCSILVPNITAGVTTSTTSTSVQAAICFTASTSILDYTANSTTSGGNNGSNNVISGCTIGGSATTLGPTYGIYEIQNTTAGNNSYLNNKIQHFYQEGLAYHTGDGITISGNDFNRLGNTTTPGVALKMINLYNNIRTAVNPIVVSNNILHDFTTSTTLYGFFHVNSSTYITGFDGGAKLSSFTGNKIYNLNSGSGTLYGVYIYQVRNSGKYDYSKNEIYRNVTTGTQYCSYTYNVDKVNMNANVIRNNKASSVYCLYDYALSSNSSFTNNLMYKNIGTSTEYGLYAQGGNGWIGNSYSNNTIAFDSIGWIPTGTTYGIYITAGSATYPRTNNIIYNNNVFIAHKGSSTAKINYGFYNLWGNTGYTEENNNIYFDTANTTPSTTYYGSDFRGSLINYPTLAAWGNSGLGYSAINFNVNPRFIRANYSDYRISNFILNNAGTNVGLSRDLLNVLRKTTAPDIGALESVFDIKADNVNVINSPVCAGYSDSIRFTVNNNSGFAFRGLSVGVMLNNALFTTATYGIVPVGLSTIVIKKPLFLAKTGTNNLKYFTIGRDDVSSLDDTIKKTVTVNASPGGSVFALKSGSKGTFNHPLGFDVTAFDEPITYTMSSPRKYFETDFGVKWSVETSVTDSGKVLTSAPYTFNHTATTELTFKPVAANVNRTLVLRTVVKDLLTGCDTLFTRTIFIAPKPVIRYTVPAAVCFKTDIDFVNNSVISSGDQTFTWNFGDGSPVYNGKFAKHNYPAAGKYTVRLTATSTPFGYVKDTTFQVEVKEIPKADFNKVNACEGENIVLTNTTTVTSGAATYEWDFGDGSAISTTKDVVKKYSTPGVYAVTLTASKAGCEQSVSKNVYQFARPDADFVKVSGECVGSPMAFSNTTVLSIGNNFALWDFDDAGSISTDAHPVHTFKTAGNKNIRLTITSEFGCRDSIVKSIVVKQAPLTDFTFTPACSSTPTRFTNTTALNGESLLSYAWNFGDGTISSATSPVKNWSGLGNKTVTLRTVLANGCSSEVSKVVVVGAQPKVDFELADACSGSQVTFGNLTEYNPSKIVYTWNFGDGNSSSVNSPNHIYNTTTSQTYTVKLKGIIINGCADSISKTVTITALPSTCDFDINGNVNSATKTNFTFVPKGGATSGINYTWTTGDGTTLTSSGTGTSYKYDAPGLFCVKMVAENVGGCKCETTKCVTLTTDIHSVESMNSALSVYPNPNNGQFEVKFDVFVNSGMSVNVYNAAGILVKTIQAGTNAANIDLSDFASGIYVVRVVADNYTATRKVTINR